MVLDEQLVARYAGFIAEAAGRDDPSEQDQAVALIVLARLAADGRLIPFDGMPRFTLLAKDDVAPHAITAYIRGCRLVGLADQADQVKLALDEFTQWREVNEDLCGMPDHPHVPTPPRNLARTEIGEGGTPPPANP